MPARSNPFQELVALIERAVAPAGASVQESALLVDVRTGNEREVDVVITVPAGPHELVIGVECRDRSRRADVTWVEEVSSKHEDLPINATVLVSNSGFTQGARTKAEAYGFEALHADDAQALDWERVIQVPESVPLDVLNCSSIIRGHIDLDVDRHDDSVAKLQVPDLAYVELLWPSGDPLGRAFDIATAYVRHPRFQQANWQKFSPGSSGESSLLVDLPAGTHFVHENERFFVRGLEVTIRVERSKSTLSFTDGVLSPALAFSHGQGTLAGAPFEIVIVEGEGQVPRVAMKLREGLPPPGAEKGHQHDGSS